MDKYKLVRKTNTHKYYKLPKPITIFTNKSFNFENELKDLRRRLKPEYEMINNECKYVCISDSKTHTERLVFAAGRIKNTINGKIIISIYSYAKIDGITTTIIEGGDHTTIHDDEVYLRHLSILNSSKNKTKQKNKQWAL